MLIWKGPEHCICGGLSGVRTWCGDVIDLPAYMGPVDVFFMNSMFGNIYSPEEALLHCALMLRPGGQIVISHPMGRPWHDRLRNRIPQTVPHALPNHESMLEMTDGLPLEVVEFVSREDLYLSVLEVGAGASIMPPTNCAIK